MSAQTPGGGTDEAACLAALEAALRERDRREVEPFVDVFAAHAAASTTARKLQAANAALTSDLEAARAESQRLYAALQASETLAARGTEAVALQAKVDSLQAELNTSYAACAQAATALKSAREAQAQADKRQRALSSEVATLRADLAASRERVAELVAALDRERDSATAAQEELSARLADREEAEARLARLQVEHLDMTQRFLSLKTEVASADASQRQSDDAIGETAAPAPIGNFPSPPPKSEQNSLRISTSSLPSRAAAVLSPTDTNGTSIQVPDAQRADILRPVPTSSAYGQQRVPQAPPLHTLRTAGGSIAHAARFAPHGAVLATGGDDKAVSLWDPLSGRLLRTLRGPLAPIRDIAWSQHDGGAALLACGDDKTLRLFHVASGECRHSLFGHALGVTACVFTGFASTDAASCGLDSCVKIWDLDAGRCTSSRTCEPDSVPMCIAAVPDVGAAIVVTGHADGSLSVWDPRCGDAAISCSEPRVRCLPRENHVSSTGSASGIISVDVCPGRPNDVLSCSSDSSLCIIDLRTLSRSRRLIGDAFHLGTGTTARASFSPDGCWACAGGAAGTLNLWPLQAASETPLVLRGHAAGVLATTWGAYPEGGLLASTDRGGAILVWAASDATDADYA